MEKSTIQDWIFLDNLRPFAEIISASINYDLLEEEWIAIDEGVKESDIDKGKWYDYEIDSHEDSVRMFFSKEHGACVVNLKVTSSKESSVLISNIIGILQNYHLSRHSKNNQ
jgi:hypothetical protein